MARATWSGTVTFGMVQIPAKLYTATAAEKKVEFNQLNVRTGNRIKQKKVDAVTGDVVPNEDIVKGYEIAKDTYVQVTDEELENVAPDKNGKIEIVGFVDMATIDPAQVSTPYFLGAGDKVNKPYALLKEAMLSTNKVAIGKFVMRSKEYLCMIRPTAEGMSVSTLRWADELRQPDEVVDEIKLSEREIAMAKKLVETYSDEVKIDTFTDTHRERIMNMIEAKSKGVELPKVEVQEVEETEDLLAALEASVALAKERRAS